MSRIGVVPIDVIHAKAVEIAELLGRMGDTKVPNVVLLLNNLSAELNLIDFILSNVANATGESLQFNDQTLSMDSCNLVAERLAGSSSNIANNVDRVVDLARRFSTVGSDDTDTIEKIRCAIVDCLETLTRIRPAEGVTDATKHINILAWSSASRKSERLVELFNLGLKCISENNENKDRVEYFLTAMVGSLSQVLEAHEPSLVAVLQEYLCGRQNALLLTCFLENSLKVFLNATWSEFLVKILHSRTMHANLRASGPPVAIFQRLDKVICSYFEGRTPRPTVELSAGIAVLLREVYTEARVVQTISNLDFAAHTCRDTVHMAPVVRAFLCTDKKWWNFTPAPHTKPVVLLVGLYQSRCFSYFRNLVVGQQCDDDQINNAFSEFLQQKRQLRLFHNNNLNCPSPGFHREDVFNDAFVFLLANSLHHVDKCRRRIFVRILFFLVCNKNRSAQLEIIRNPRSITALRLFLSVMTELHLFVAVPIKGSKQRTDVGIIKTFVFEKLHLGAPSLMDSDFNDAIEMLTRICTDTISIDVNHFSRVLNHQGRLGKVANGREAVLIVLRRAFAGESIHTWQSDTLATSFFHLDCTIAYPFDNFKIRCKNQNRTLIESNLLEEDFMEMLFKKLETPEKFIFNYRDISEKWGYKFVHDNQHMAIIAGLEATANEGYFFGKLGTGQGKSLIFAVLALHLAKQGKKVAMFSCFHHLAARDFNAFEPMFKANGIKCRLVKGLSAHEPDIPTDVQIIYADLSNFVSHYGNSLSTIFRGGTGDNERFDIFSFDTVLLDEFDALLLDAGKISNKATDMADVFSIRPGDMEDAEDVSKNFLNYLCMKNPSIGTFMQNMRQSGLSHLVERWVNHFSGNAEEIRADYIGIQTHFLGGQGFHIPLGEFYILVSKFYLASFLLAAKSVIGLSGSITPGAMEVLKSTITEVDKSKPITFLTIPNFFGVSDSWLKGNAHLNCKDEEGNLKLEEWRDRIAKDILHYKDKAVPILVFANVNNPEEWEYLRDLIPKLCCPQRTFLEIMDEDVIEDKVVLARMGEPAYITLSSHICGRGVDIKIPKESKRAGGMHVLITYQPGPGDYRLLMQMKGRCARLSDDGSYSVLTREALLKPADADCVTVEHNAYYTQFNEMVSGIGGRMFQEEQLSSSYVQNWLLLLNALVDEAEKTWPAALGKLNNKDRIAAVFNLITNSNVNSKNILGDPTICQKPVNTATASRGCILL